MLQRNRAFHAYFAIAAAALVATGITGDAGMKKTSVGLFLVALGALWIGALVWNDE